MAYETNELNVNTSKHRFEMNADGATAFIDYKQRGDTFYLIHTETPPELEGKGIASALVEKTLNYLKQNHLKLVPLCPFVQSYLRKHPEWNQLVKEDE